MQTMYMLAAKAAAAMWSLQIAAHQVVMQVCDALKQCGTLNLNLLNIPIQNWLCWTQVWLRMSSRKDQGQYSYNKSIPYQYVPVKAFADAFQRFHVGEWLYQELTIPFDRTKCHPAALVTKKYALSNWETFQASYAREKLLMNRNAFVCLKTVRMHISSI